MYYFLKIFFWFIWWIAFLVTLLFGLFNVPGLHPREDVTLGITFSARYATDLGLDWKETYLALLDDMGVRKVRIPVYWDLTEPQNGNSGSRNYSFCWAKSSSLARMSHSVLGR